MRANPWWRSANWRSDDPHLRRLGEQPARLPAPVADAIDLWAPAVHLLRGPRQVGKSTDLKLMVLRGLAEGRAPESILDYVESLAAGYFALILYFWKQDSGTADFSKDKKIYFGDPLLHTITTDRVGLAPDPHAQVENTVAMHLFRRYEPVDRQAETFPAADRLHAWRTGSGGEIDFVCGPREAVHAVEVADWPRVNRQKATAPMRALPGRPSLVLTRDQLEFGPTMSLVPAALALWGLSGSR